MMITESKPHDSRFGQGQKATAKDVAQNEHLAKRFWLSLVVLLLGLQLIIGFVAIRLATGDRSVAIVPDYHNAALNWDVEHASRTLSDRKGWALDIHVSEQADTTGKRAIRVSIIDQQGQSVDDLALKATAFHHARGNEAINFDLNPIGNGVYQALAPIGRRGIWELRLLFSIGEQSATLIRNVEVQ